MEKSILEIIMEAAIKNQKEMMHNQMHGIGKGWNSVQELLDNDKRNLNCQCDECKNRKGW